MRFIVIAILIMIFVSLGSALFMLLKGHSGDKRVVKALGVRVGLSVLLFIMLQLAAYTGFIKTHL